MNNWRKETEKSKRERIIKNKKNLKKIKIKERRNKRKTNNIRIENF